MNEIYGGLRSNPVNTFDTSVKGSVTYTFNGTIVEAQEPQSEPQQEVPVIEVFSDSDCTTYATGVLDTVFIRINKDIELTPDPEYPGEAAAVYGNYIFLSYNGGDGWSINAFIDFNSSTASPGQPNPFKEGAVLDCTSPDYIDITEYKKAFYESDRTI